MKRTAHPYERTLRDLRPALALQASECSGLLNGTPSSTLPLPPFPSPDALQAAECTELLNPVRANCWISARALYDFIGGSEGVTGLSTQ